MVKYQAETDLSQTGVTPMTAVNQNDQLELEHSALGKKSAYINTYTPDLLFPIARAGKRLQIGISSPQIPFYGFDYWNHYEVSWLNEKGKPVVGFVELVYDCNTPCIIESKSLKLYFNSFNNSHFADAAALAAIIQADLELRVEGTVHVRIFPLDYLLQTPLTAMKGFCLDELDISCSEYLPNPALLTTTSGPVTSESLFSDLLKSNCLITHQADWASLQISYTGKPINHAGLLQYIVSFRNHNEFHEQCVERIYMDIMRQCQPEELTVYARYTRRGGLDINPFRSSKPCNFTEMNPRLPRQ